MTLKIYLFCVACLSCKGDYNVFHGGGGKGQIFVQIFVWRDGVVAVSFNSVSLL